MMGGERQLQRSGAAGGAAEDVAEGAPLDLLSGWVHPVASVNPATALLQAERAG